MGGYFNRLLAKTNQIFQLAPEIASHTDITGEDKLVVYLEPHSGLLLASSGIDRSQTQIQAIKNLVALGGLAFLDDFTVKLLHQQHRGPSGQDVGARKSLSRRASCDQGNDF